MTDWEQHIADTCRRLTALNRERALSKHDDGTVWPAFTRGRWGFHADGLYAFRDGFDEAAAAIESLIRLKLAESDAMAPWFDPKQVVLGGQ